MTHAVLIVGMTRDASGSILFKVENSHGTAGNGGYYTMSQSYFSEYVYEVAVLKSLLSERHRGVLESDEKDLIHLDPWDPLGALACGLCT